MSILSPVLERSLAAVARPRRTGRVSRMVGFRIDVEGIEAAVGDAVRIYRHGGVLDAEVVSAYSSKLACAPLGDLTGVRCGDEAEALGHPLTVRVGEELLGRVLDGLGRPVDGGAPLDGLEEVTMHGQPPHPLERDLVDTQLALGIRAIDTLIPCGKGQRLGIFAGSGVGKSSLLSMIMRGTDAAVSVLALVGERGREVNEFIRRDLGPEGLARSVIVVATSDRPAMVRVRAAFTAIRIAEWFRDQGLDVLFMMDSLTRFAMAQREIGLAAGEPPATRGYPPSVFSLMPMLLERAGISDRGSITGLYSVLVEGDDMNEPISDAARAILDGHIVLSRRLATGAHFPAIEVLESISRLEPAITTPEHRRMAQGLRALLAAYRDAKDLVEIGAYVRGTNPLVDRAIELQGQVDAFLRQDLFEVAPLMESKMAMSALMGGSLPVGSVAGGVLPGGSLPVGSLAGGSLLGGSIMSGVTPARANVANVLGGGQG